MGSKYRSLEYLEESVKANDSGACFFLNGGRMRLSGIINQYLEANNMTMVEFAKRSGSNKGWLSTYKLGKHKGISVHAIHKIAQSLNIDPVLLAQQIFLTPAVQPVSQIEKLEEIPIEPFVNKEPDESPVYVTVDGMQFVVESLENAAEPVVIERAGWRIAMSPA